MTMPAPLVLYGNDVWTSPYVLSCFIALREKAIPFEVKTLALHRGEQREETFVRTSLTARVPLVVDGDFALSESSAIVEYLEDAYPAPAYPRVLPAEVRTRARARQIMAWVRSDLMPIREERSAEYVFYDHRDLAPFASLSDAGRRAADKLLAAADHLVPADGSPLFGAWCIADTDLAMMLQRLVKTGWPVPDHVRTFVEAQWARPSVQAFVTQPRPPFARAVL